MSKNHRDMVNRFFQEVWHEKRSETIYEMVAQDCICHLESGKVIGPTEFEGYFSLVSQAFLDLHMHIEDVISDGEAVVIRWRATGSHHGAGFGLEATGKPIDERGITWWRVRDGKIVEGWDAWNMGGLMQKLSS